MRPLSPDVEAADPALLRDKALNLREAVNSSRARMNAQAERLERLRFEIAQLRALVQAPVPAATHAAVAVPALVPVVVRAPAPKAAAPAPLRTPISKEAAPGSAPATASFKNGVLTWKNLPYALILFAAIAIQIHPALGRAPAAPSAAPALVATAAPLPPSPSSPEVIGEDDGAAEALLLAHEWHLPGDDRPLAERLGSGTTPPGALPEWMVEPTGEGMYRVSFRPGRADIGYDFDVDLNARRVDPTPETAELIAPRLASRR